MVATNAHGIVQKRRRSRAAGRASPPRPRWRPGQGNRPNGIPIHQASLSADDSFRDGPLLGLGLRGGAPPRQQAGGQRQCRARLPRLDLLPGVRVERLRSRLIRQSIAPDSRNAVRD